MSLLNTLTQNWKLVIRQNKNTCKNDTTKRRFCILLWKFDKQNFEIYIWNWSQIFRRKAMYNLDIWNLEKNKIIYTIMFWVLTQYCKVWFTENWWMCLSPCTLTYSWQTGFILLCWVKGCTRNSSQKRVFAKSGP